MPVDLSVLLTPGHTALLTVEVQVAVLGEHSPIPVLADAVRDAGVLPRIGALARAARLVGVPVVHCTAERRADGLGASRNCRLLAAFDKHAGGAPSGSGGGAVHPDIGPTERDIVLPRFHGVSPMTGTEVDAILRNLGVSTIVATGVSVNVALLGLCFEAVNLGYQVVVPRDATAGIGDEYVDAVFENTLPLLATITTTQAVSAVWEAA